MTYLKAHILEKFKQADIEKSSTDDKPTIQSSQSFPICEKLQEIFSFIEKYYCESISLNDVAKALGYSPAYLTDLVRRHTGYPVNHWIIKRRMEAAKKLLQGGDQSVCEIALSLGYQNVSHFFRQFRQYYGTTPTNWRKENKCK